jgi:hypothetical protein
LASRASREARSSSTSSRKISGGLFKHIDLFDIKGEIEEYIHGLPIKSAFYAPGYFMQTFTGFMAPQPAGDGSYTISGIVSPQTQVPLIDRLANSGKYVGAILAAPEKFEGKTISDATRLTSFEEANEDY